jgi:transposase InsO family protein
MNPPSYSTVRRILISENIIGKSFKRAKRSYPRRQRYEKEGLMVQIDGSHHRWIHGAEMMCLTAAIDDATGKILGAKFTKTETTFAAMDVVEQIICDHGVFQMLYSDRAGIYGGGKRDGYSNMNRAMRSLGIVPIQAGSPQAKGRVERLFKTLQDRLCSEMRLSGVKNMKEANEFLKRYLLKFNEQFGVKALSLEHGYRKLDDDINLDDIFTMMTLRKVQCGEVVHLNSAKYVLKTDISLVGKEAEVREYRDGRMEIYVLGEKVEYNY